MKPNNIQSQEYDEKRFKKLLLDFIKQKPEGFRMSEAVIATGISNDWVEFTLRQLLQDYSGRIELTDDHQLFYIFDLNRKSENVLKNLALFILQSTWRFFTIVFKAWIVLMLCSYFLVNALILIAFVTFVIRNASLIETIFSSIKLKKGENFLSKGPLHSDIIKPVFAYVFGEPKTKKDALAAEKLILQQINANQGYLFTSDIIRLTGCSLAEAQTQAAQILANYQGEVSVNEQGVIQYYFVELSQKDTAQSPKAIWERLIPKQRLNNNEAGMNQTIAGINGFNVLMSFFALGIVYYFMFNPYDESVSEIDWITLYGDFMNPLSFFLFWFPLIFSVLFFLIPAGRYLVLIRKNKQLAQLNQQYKILEQLFAQIHSYLPQSKLIAKVGKQYSNQVQETALSLGASLEINEEGESYWLMEDIAAEQKQAEQLRSA